MKKIYLLVLLFLTSIPVYSSHLAGGTITYECLGNGQYEITVVLYRDCNGTSLTNTIPMVADPISGGSNVTWTLTRQSYSTIPLTTSNPCMTIPSSLCYEEHVYTTIQTFASNSGGYLVGVTINARNSGITNITNSQSVSQTLGATIPNPSTYNCNSSPVWNNDPVYAFCNNFPLTVNYAATDPDGDSLAYRLCSAYQSGPPYNVVPYANPYSGLNPLSASPALAVDPVTGQMTGTPNLTGQFVVTVCVDEYRNGVKIGEYRRESQFNVITCSSATLAGISVPSSNQNGEGGNGQDTIWDCNNFTVSFTDNSVNATTFFWDFGVPNISSDTSNQASPTYTYPDTGSYTAMQIVNPGTVCADTAIVTVMVYPSITPNYTYSGVLCTGNPISFNDQSTATYGNIVSWNWDFSFGSSSTQQNPTHSFNIGVNTNVKLTVTSDKGCVKSITKTLNIGTSPTIDLGPDPSICLGDSVTINSNSNAISVNWSPATGLSCSNCKDAVASPSTTTTYTVTASSPFNNCALSDTITVHVLGVPDVDAGPDTLLCNNDSMQANVTATEISTGYTVQWNPSTGLSNDTILDPFINPASTTTYTVTVTNAGGCFSSDTVTVSREFVSLDAGPDTAICNGDTVQLKASHTGVINWSPATGLSCTNCPSPKAFPTATTAYIASATAPLGCKVKDTLEVQALGLPTINAGPDLVACNNDSVQLNMTATNLGTSGFTVQWNPSSGVHPVNSLTPKALPASTTTFTVTVTNAGGCVATDEITIARNILTLNMGNEQVICFGDTVGISASSPDNVSYTWSPGGTLSSISGQSAQAFPTTTTTYTMTIVDGDNCVLTDTVTVKVNPLPNIDAGSAATNCSGAGAQLNASGGSVYVWDNDPTLSCTSCPNPVASPTVQTIYYVTGTDSNSCVNTDSIVVGVHPKPVVTAFGGTMICLGDSTQLSASGALTYSWTPSTGLSNANVQNPMASPASNTTYTVLGTDVNGCTDTGIVTVNVQAIPTFNLDSSKVYCIGDSLALGLQTSGSYNFQWSPATNLSCTNCPNPWAKPQNDIVYTVTATSSNGCVRTDSIDVTVIKNLPINMTPDFDLCYGDSNKLASGGGVSYSWTPATDLSCSNCPDPIAFPKNSTQYTVTVTDQHGCVDDDSVNITVNPLPIVTTTNDTVCIGDTATLTASGGVSYSWAPNSIINCVTCPTAKVWPTKTTTYTATVTDANNCKNTGTAMSYIRSLPQIDAGSNSAICIGDSMQLQASGGVSYQWHSSGTLSCLGCPDPWVKPAITTTYYVTGVDQYGCIKQDSIQISVNSLPTINISPSNPEICEGGSIQLFASGGSNYQWSTANGNGSLSCTNCPDPTVNPIVNTKYKVLVTDGNSCVSEDSIDVTVNSLPAVSFSSVDTTICINDSAQITASGGISYQWAPASSGDCTNCPTATLFPTNNQVFTVTVTDANNCENTGTTNVDVRSLPDPQAEPDTAICPGESAPLRAYNGVSYQWQPAQSLVDPATQFPLASPSATTDYTVEIVDIYGCEGQDQVTVTVNPLPLANAGFDQTIYEDEYAQLNASGGVDYLWSPTLELTDVNSPSPVATPDDTITYTVLVTDANGCINTDEVTIFVVGIPKVYMPTAFSPNDDGRNDLFYPGFEQNFNLIRLQVFNRWGQKVFETTDPDEGWDGTSGGIDQPMGTYIYTIVGEDDTGKPVNKQGNLTLIR